MGFVVCYCCINDEVPDQWQIEVSGIPDNPPDWNPWADAANGVYILDDVLGVEAIDSWWQTCATTDRSGCGDGCADMSDCTQVADQYYTPALSTYAWYSWMFFAAGVEGLVSGTNLDIFTGFFVHWRNFDGATCGPSVSFIHDWGTATKTSFSPVLCSQLEESEKIDCTSLSGLRMYPTSPEHEPGYCDVFIVDGF